MTKSTVNNLPSGTRDLLFEEVTAQRETLNKLNSLYEALGFLPVETPTVEFYDVFDRHADFISQEQMLKVNGTDGKIAVLRPDNTAPIARLTATKFRAEGLPQKLCYSQSVFRVGNTYAAEKSEILQSGIEIIGESGESADLFALFTAAEALRLCSADFKIEIGHAKLFEALTRRFALNDGQRDILKSYLATRNSSGYPFFEDSEAMDTARRLALLCGGSEILEEAKELCGGDKEALDILEYLGRIYNNFADAGYKDNIIIDLGMVQSIDYYSGMVFRGYIGGIGSQILSGGRYDTLLGCFGVDTAACGFAVNVSEIAEHAEKEPLQPTSLPFDFSNGADSLITAKKYIEALKLSETKQSTSKSTTDSDKIKIALTKGRIETGALKILEKCGYDISIFANKGRKLIFECGNLEIMLAKAADVITYVEHGVCDVGIVGRDTIMEHGGSFYESVDLGFGKCALALAGKKGQNFYDGYAHKKVASKYPETAKRYFQSRGMDVELIKIDGSVELAPLLQLSDAIVDIVETGETLKENGLEVYEKITDISARLIVNSASMKVKHSEISKLVKAIMNNRKG